MAETIGSKLLIEKLRLDKKDKLRAPGLTKEMVLNHASKVSKMLLKIESRCSQQRGT